ncbi:hypothetical protein BCR39DRAFT_64201 [Naematelia encephala]|uniref:Uncharacterized protein n=1 Tax=Naematelia encephala TaxID=71784 RepID=A0A1Y2AFY1_9TREE|nr:hypothetical protein BCR39DRAFT_64201 [Naematelia encephala]
MPFRQSSSGLGPCRRCFAHLMKQNASPSSACYSSISTASSPSNRHSSASRHYSSPLATSSSSTPKQKHLPRLQPPSEYPSGRSSIFYPPFYPAPVGQENATLRKRRIDEAERVRKYEPGRAERARRDRQWAEPSYRMRKSPMRQCIVTRQLIPREFLISLRPNISIDRLYLLPQDILLPDPVVERKPKLGLGYYVTCHKDVLSVLPEKGPHLGFFSRRPVLGTMKIPETLPSMIHSQLCQRILQESKQLSRSSNTSSMNPTINQKEMMIRYLTIEEIEKINNNHKLDEDHNIISILDLSSSPTHQQKEPHSLLPGPKRKKIPTYTLTSLLPPNIANEVITALSTMLDPTTTTPGPPKRAMVAVRSWPTPLDSDSPGHLAVPLTIALWRLACWHGYGWKEYAVSKTGQKI